MVEKNQKTKLTQLILRGAIFLIFFFGIFVKVPSFFIYLLFPIIIANIVFGIINKKRGIFINIIFLILTPLLLVFLLGYIITIIGAIISLIHLILFFLWYRKGDEEVIVDKK